MTEPLAPLDPDVRDLLAEEKAVVELDSSRKEAIFATAMARVGGGAPGSGTASSEASASARGGGATPAPPPSIDAASSARTTGSLASTGLSGTRAVMAVLTTFAIGVGAGVALDRQVLAPSSPSTVPSPPPPMVPTASTASATISAPEASDTARDRPGVPVSSLPEVGAAPSTGVSTLRNDGAASARGLAAERALLDVARRSLASGDPNAALAASDRHAKEYPGGALVEEREAIAIKSLVALGRSDEAKARAGAFERRFPSSLLLRAVRSAAFGVP